MRGFTRYPMLDDQGFPGRIDRWRLRKEEKHALDPFQFRGRLSRCHAEAVFSDWTGRHRPHLDQILRHDVKFSALPRQKADGSFSGNIKRMVGL